MLGKKRTRQQRQGESAEQAFSQFAHDNGLIPGKPPDYGLDYLCQVEDTADMKGTARVLGDVLAAVVRSSEAKRPKLRLKRNDAERVMQSKVPVLLVMPHRPPGARHWTIRAKAVDQPTFFRLADFINGTDKQLDFAPSELASENDFSNEVQSCLHPRLIESLSASLVEHRLKGILPSPDVSVITKSDGSYSVVKTSNYLAQFDINTERAWLSFHRRIVDAPDQIEMIANTFGMKSSVLDALQSLPQPVVVGGPCPLPVSGPQTLYIVGPTGQARCNFLATHFAKHTSFVHKSGFTLRISEAMPQDGMHVHVMHTELEVPVDLGQHPDLRGFLEKCIPPAELSFRASGGGIPVASTGDLRLFGLYTFEVGRFDPQEEDATLRYLVDAPPAGDSLMLALVTYARETGFPGGFAIGEHTSEEPARFVLPVVGNVGARTLIASFACEGIVFLDDEEQPVGLTSHNVIEVHLEWRPERTTKSEYPELLIQPKWATIAFTPDGERHIIKDGIQALDGIGIRFY
jgi:hypothetical protein